MLFKINQFQAENLLHSASKKKCRKWNKQVADTYVRRDLRLKNRFFFTRLFFSFRLGKQDVPIAHYISINKYIFVRCLFLFLTSSNVEFATFSSIFFLFLFLLMLCLFASDICLRILNNRNGNRIYVVNKKSMIVFFSLDLIWLQWNAFRIVGGQKLKPQFFSISWIFFRGTKNICENTSDDEWIKTPRPTNQMRLKKNQQKHLKLWIKFICFKPIFVFWARERHVSIFRLPECPRNKNKFSLCKMMGNESI